MSDQSERPALKIQELSLVDCHFAILGAPSKTLCYSLQLVQYEKRFSEDRQALIILLGFDAFFEVENPCIEAKFKFAITYRVVSGSGEVLEGLKDPIVLAHSLPFVREFLASMTSRMGMPTLVIDVANAHAMFRQYLNRFGSSPDLPVAE